MKKPYNYFTHRLVPYLWISVFMLAGLLISCDRSAQSLRAEDATHLAAASGAKAQPPLPHSGNLVEVKTEHMNFIIPDEIPSGWTTFRYQNVSTLEHFMQLDKMPVFEGEQKTFENFGEVGPVFIDAMDLINQGKTDEGLAEFSRLPPWFSQIIFSGGVGLVSPGETAQSTVYVAPGEYVIECYVKTGGKFHPMAKRLVVTEESGNGKAPEPTLSVTLSREAGIEVDQEIRRGLHTIAVHFKDQAPHEHFLGNDVHLVKLADDIDITALDAWMNWMDPKGLNTPAPATFLGGVQDMPAGKTGYFTVNIKPGRYAWISEVPNPSSKGMLKTFTVPFTESTTDQAGK